MKRRPLRGERDSGDVDMGCTLPNWGAKLLYQMLHVANKSIHRVSPAWKMILRCRKFGRVRYSLILDENYGLYDEWMPHLDPFLGKGKLLQSHINIVEKAHYLQPVKRVLE